MKIKVTVRPNSKREEVVKVSDEEYLVSLKEPAREGKANAKLIKLLAREFGVNSRSIKIKNPRSKKKVIDI